MQVALASVGRLLYCLPVLRECPQLLQRVALLMEPQVAAEGVRGPPKACSFGRDVRLGQGRGRVKAKVSGHVHATTPCRHNLPICVKGGAEVLGGMSASGVVRVLRECPQLLQRVALLMEPQVAAEGRRLCVCVGGGGHPYIGNPRLRELM
jgi:hypothetical protein